METAFCEFMASRSARLRGLIGRVPDRAWHVLAPCDDVHTFGMRHELDIAFVARGGEVLAVHRRVGRSRRLRCRQAAMTVERFARDGPWLMPGDRIGLTIANGQCEPEGTEEGAGIPRKEER